MKLTQQLEIDNLSTFQLYLFNADCTSKLHKESEAVVILRKKCTMPHRLSYMLMIVLRQNCTLNCYINPYDFRHFSLGVWVFLCVSENLPVRD